MEELANAPWWAQIIGIILTVGLPMAFKYFRAKWLADADLARIDATKSLLEQKEVLLRRVGDTTMRCAELWAITYAPKIVADIADGGKFDWERHLSEGKDYVKKEVIACFKHEGIELIDAIGVDRLDGMISATLVKATEFLPTSIQEKIPGELLEMASGAAGAFLAGKAKDWAQNDAK